MARLAETFTSYSLVQLNELLEDDEKLSRIITGMDEMCEVQLCKEMTLASNRSLAEQNLLLQPGLDQQKILLTKRYCCLQELYETYQLRKSTLDHRSGNSSLDTLLALLQAEGAKIEEETENLADSFLDGDLSLDSFIEAYQSKRKLAHVRRVKIDKLQEMLLRCFQTNAAAATTSSSSSTRGSANDSIKPPAPASPSPFHTNGPPAPCVTPSYSSPVIPQLAPPDPALTPRIGFILQ